MPRKSSTTGSTRLDRELFVQEYLKDMNASRAYERTAAAIGRKFASENSLRVSSHKYFNQPDVQVAIQAAMDKRAARVGFDADKVLEELAKIAFSDVTELYNDDGTLKDIRSLDPVLRKAISGFDIQIVKGERGEEPIRVQRVKLWDKLSALEKLGKHLKLFHDQKVEVSGADGGPILPSAGLTDLELARKLAFILSKPLKKKTT